MSRKAKTLRALTDYFLEKGEILDRVTYAKQDDVPVLPRNVKRILGNWSRLPRMIKVNYPEDYAKIMEVEEVVEEVKVEVKVTPKVVPKFIPKFVSKPKVEAKKDEK
jgi:hypothetical protein